MKKIILVLGLLLMISPVLADDYPKSDRFNITYDEVNDVTTISDKETSGQSIPGTGDAFTGHSLYFTVQIKFQGKRYNPDDAENTTVDLIFTELHYRADDTSNLYEDQDNIALLIDGTRFKLGKADYSQNVGGDAFIGKKPLEILTVPVDVSLLNTIAAGTKVLGSITAKKANDSGPFTFDKNDFELVEKALDLLNSLKQKPPAQ